MEHALTKMQHGAWPVMLTPYTAQDTIDVDTLDRYVDWLIERGANGLFPVALSGEMYELTEQERLEIARRVVRRVDGRVPVAAAIADVGTAAKTSRAVARMAQTGVDIVVLVASVVLEPDDDESVFLDVVQRVIADNPDVALGVYECPIPYHRLLSDDLVARIAGTGRFVFMKETSHDVDVMAARVRVAMTHGLHVFNAGIEDHVQSLAVGVAGLSGWVVNVAPDLVAELDARCVSGAEQDAHELQEFLVGVEQRMGATYPGSAKAIVEARAGIGFRTASRWRPATIDEADARALARAIDEEVALSSTAG